MKRWPAKKDPDEVLDFEIDWSARLGDSDAISSVTWTVPAGLTKESQSNTTTVAVVWLSGGLVADESYQIGCRIVTTGGRTYDQTGLLVMKEA